jgi:hypothetical protein
MLSLSFQAPTGTLSFTPSFPAPPPSGLAKNWIAEATTIIGAISTLVGALTALIAAVVGLLEVLTRLKASWGGNATPPTTRGHGPE